MRRLGFIIALGLFALAACGSDDKQETAGPEGSTATTATTLPTPRATLPQSSSATTVAAANAGCGVTLADVQALLAANSGVTQNRTPDATRCNFTWSDNGPRGIDVARVPGGRAAFEAQSGKVPNGPTALKDGTPYENLSGLGERAWAYGTAKQANVVVLKGADLYAVDLVIDGTPPAGAKSPTGMDAKSLEICQALAKKALA